MRFGLVWTGGIEVNCQKMAIFGTWWPTSFRRAKGVFAAHMGFTKCAAYHNLRPFEWGKWWPSIGLSETPTYWPSKNQTLQNEGSFLTNNRNQEFKGRWTYNPTRGIHENGHRIGKQSQPSSGSIGKASPREVQGGEPSCSSWPRTGIQKPGPTFHGEGVGVNWIMITPTDPIYLLYISGNHGALDVLHKNCRYFFVFSTKLCYLISLLPWSRKTWIITNWLVVWNILYFSIYRE